MTGRYDRREFVKLASYGLAGWGLAPPGSTTLRDLLAGAPPGSAELPPLPPLTIGARTDGGNFRFDPVGLHLRAGGEVVWLNMGDFHTASAFHPDNAKLLQGGVPLRIPQGAESWHSEMLGLTATEFRHSFDLPGVYDYFCQPHYSFGMVGRIVVGEEPAFEGYPAEQLNEASREQMPSLEAVVGPAGRAFEWAARVNGVLLTAAGGGDAAAAAAAVEAGMRRDEILSRALADPGRVASLEAAASRFVEGATEGIDYESLLARADAVKAVLERATHGASY